MLIVKAKVSSTTYDDWKIRSAETRFNGKLTKILASLECSVSCAAELNGDWAIINIYRCFCKIRSVIAVVFLSVILRKLYRMGPAHTHTHIRHRSHAFCMLLLALPIRYSFVWQFCATKREMWNALYFYLFCFESWRSGHTRTYTHTHHTYTHTSSTDFINHALPLNSIIKKIPWHIQIYACFRVIPTPIKVTYVWETAFNVF